MGQLLPCRVQWVARRKDMRRVVDSMTRGGGRLVSRSDFEAATEGLDDLADADTGELSIAEFSIDPLELTRQVVATTNRLAPGDTLIIDLTDALPRVQLLPASGDHGIIVRNIDGARRFARSSSGFGRDNARWLVAQLTDPTPVHAGAV